MLSFHRLLDGMTKCIAFVAGKVNQIAGSIHETLLRRCMNAVDAIIVPVMRPQEAGRVKHPSSSNDLTHALEKASTSNRVYIWPWRGKRAG